ncbi:MAG: DUF4907 domain-containing protein [Tenuifilaceae bacterium]
MKKNILIISQFIIILVLTGLLVSRYFKEEKPGKLEQAINKDNPYINANLQFELITAENNTWGYKILLEGNPMIIQTNKPGLPGNEGFKTKESAQKVAELIISKIRKGEMPPTVTIEELNKLGVLK